MATTKFPIGASADDGGFVITSVTQDGGDIFAVSVGGIKLNKSSLVMGALASATSIVASHFNVMLCVTDVNGQVYYIPAQTSSF